MKYRSLILIKLRRRISLKQIVFVALVLSSINSSADQSALGANKTIVCGISVDTVGAINIPTDTYRLKDDYESIGAKVKVCRYGVGYAVVAQLTNGRIEALLNLNIK